MSHHFHTLELRYKSWRDNIRIKGLWVGTMNMFYESLFKRQFGKMGISYPDYSNHVTDTSEKAVHHDSIENFGSSYLLMHKAFRRIPILHEDITMLDLGCGSGKAMVAAMKLGFRKVYGVDIDLLSLAQAEKNCSRMQESGSQTSFELISGDACTVDIPEGTNLVYLFNPFGRKTLESVIKNMSDYVKKTKMVLYVIYLNPTIDDAFKADKNFKVHYAGFFRHGKYPEMTIYRVLPG